MKATDVSIIIGDDRKTVTAWWHHDPLSSQTIIVTVCDGESDIYNRLPSSELEKVIDAVAKDAARLTFEEREELAKQVFKQKSKKEANA